MRYLLCGSFAYDTILLHAGRFETHLLPEALARLNVSFGVNSALEEFGGTAGNIAYNAAILHQDTELGTQPIWPVLAGTLGAQDAGPYLERLSKCGHDATTMTILPDARCAHAWILTDEQNNQISAFSPGAMKSEMTLPAEPPALWHVAPELAPHMCSVAQQAMKKNATFFFDPGQALPSLLNENTIEPQLLTDILETAQGIFVNDYEAALLEEKTKRSLQSWIKAPGQFVVRTLGGAGVELIEHDKVTVLSVAKAARVTDPTGCGDAFRAGFIHGYLNNWNLSKCAQLGAAMGSLAVETSGGQNHQIQDGLLSTRMATCTVLSCEPHLREAA